MTVPPAGKSDEPDEPGVAGAAAASARRTARPAAARELLRAGHAEWTKLRTVPSTAWLMLAVVASTVAVGGTVVLSMDSARCGDGGCDPDVARLSLSGVYLGQLAVVVLAALAVTNEYASGMIRTTLAANPRRATVLSARTAAVTAVVLVGGLLGVLGSLGAAWGILAGGSPPPAPLDGPTLRAAGGTVLYLGLVALLTLGVGAAVQDTAATISSVLSLLLVPQILRAFVNDPRWAERIEKYSPMTAGLSVQVTKRLDALPIGPWAGLGVLAAYATAATLVGAAMFVLRDA